MNILCIDPGTKCGWATSWGASGVARIEPAPARKGKPGKDARIHKRTGVLLAPAVPEVASVMAEPDHVRLIKFWVHLGSVATAALEAHVAGLANLVLVHEGPLKHHPGVRAAQLAFWWQAGLILWAHSNRVRRVEVAPLDLQRFVLGRAATPGENEVLLAARTRLGYEGADDNEADALWLLAWAHKHVVLSLEEERSSNDRTQNGGGSHRAISGIVGGSG